MQEELDTRNKVVPLFSEDKVKQKANDGEVQSEEITQYFTTVLKRNEEIRERLRKERAKANKSVLKSYRIKP